MKHIKHFILFFFSLIVVDYLNAQFKGVENSVRRLGFMRCTKVIASDENLPEIIKSSIDSIFSYRLGSFKSKVKYSSGNWINLIELFKFMPSQKFTWQVPEFELYYSFSDSNLGINRYIAALWLDHFGQIIRFDFPHLSEPKTIEFIKWDKAYSEAKKHIHSIKVLDEGQVTDFKYDKITDKMIWEVSFFLEKSENSWKNYHIFIDAITGEFIRNEESQGFIMY